jgi:hypothetical protein
LTADQLALANLEVLKLQTWITGLAIFVGPLFGVLFTLWFQSRKDRKDAQQRLFTMMLANRKFVTITPDMARSLNTIDVVFADHKAVRDLWSRYYSLLSQPPGEERGHVWLELLGEMAKVLGYRNVTAVHLDKYYYPQGHANEAEFQLKMAKLWERVLENTEHFVVAARAEGGAVKPEAAQDKPDATKS